MRDAMRDVMRAELKEAMRARDTNTRDALRTVLAAIENAEAVPLQLGVTEVPRRQLTGADVAGIVRAEIDRLDDAAAEMAAHGQQERAEDLRKQAATLRGYV